MEYVELVVILVLLIEGVILWFLLISYVFPTRWLVNILSGFKHNGGNICEQKHLFFVVKDKYFPGI